MPAFLARFWPRRLQARLLLTIALVLLVAQAISAGLLYRAETQRVEAGLVHGAAMRLFAAAREDRLHPGSPPRPPGGEAPPPPPGDEGAGGEHPPHGPPGDIGGPGGPPLAVRHEPHSPVAADEPRSANDERELRKILGEQVAGIGEVMVVHRPLASDPALARRVARRAALLGAHGPQLPNRLLLAAVELRGNWLVVTAPVPHLPATLLWTLIGQTLLLFGLLFGAIALLLGHITRPLAALTRRLDHFTPGAGGEPQLTPEGPEDIRELIVAHNRMESRIAALLDEKDVMLGAIGHDLKTPLAALRVRIETVEDEAERRRMAATIEDLSRSLDDILSLARVGRPSDPREPCELNALIGAIVEEFEDTGKAVAFAPGARLVAPVRATWLRRALRNLIGNAVRYGKQARIAVEPGARELVIAVDDDGPGIPDHQIAAMMEPFARGEPSRSSETGGAGLGLTLARAIAEQHGGSLTLANRRDATGRILGLGARLILPLH